MKRFALIAVMAVGLAQAAAAVQEVDLTEAWLVSDRETEYVPLKAQAHFAGAEGHHQKAAELYLQAAAVTPMSWVRSAMYCSAAFHLLRIRKCGRSLDLYGKAADLMDLADNRGSGTETKRAKVRANIDWGLERVAVLCR